jgi:peptidoglycan hydrolase-like protein with peptidoglycan-binding domain
METWNLGYVMPCGETRPAHGVMIDEIDDVGSSHFFDQYQPYLKNFHTDYPIPIVMNVVVTVKKPTPVINTQHQFNVDLKYGMENNEVKELQKALKVLGYFTLEPTGYFGPRTKQSVIAFQMIKNLPQTGFVGPLTRAELNKKLSTV